MKLYCNPLQQYQQRMRDQRLQLHQTIRKHPMLVMHSRSCQHVSPQLNPKEVKIMLSGPIEGKNIENKILKQQILMRKGMFDPYLYFGGGEITSIEESERIHSDRLANMFSKSLQRSFRLHRKGGSFGNQSVSPRSPFPKKNKVVEADTRNSKKIGRSPKNFVKENKQNYMKMNMNNLQKMRVKLKLNKK